MDRSSLRALLLLLLCLCGRSLAEDILPEGPLNVLVGTNAIFKTLLKKPDFSVILWNFNNGLEMKAVATLTAAGVTPGEGYEGRANIDSNGTLTLQSVTEADSGEYSVNLIETSGHTLPGEIDLRVMVPVSDVKISANVVDAIEHNGTVVLTCSAKGSFLRFKWLNGSMPITGDGKRVTVQKTDTTSILTFAPPLRYDLEGPLYCTAYNTLSNATGGPFALMVSYGPEQVTLTPPLPSEFVASGSNLTLSCNAMSRPPASYEWFHGDTKLTVTGPQLKLEDIEKAGLGKTKGSYTCKANNKETKKTVSSPAVSFTVIEKIVGVKLSGPEGKLFAGNSSANLSCSAEKGSMAMVKWLKNGAALSAGGRVVVAADGKSVLIEPLQKEDNGEFTCDMSNPVSKETAKVKLTVFYGPEPVQLSGENEVEVTDEVTMECAAASMPPAQLTWKRNGTVTAVTGKVFAIKSATFADTGTYLCEAFNPTTGKTTSKSHFLSVKAEGELDPTLSDGAIAGIVIGVLAAVALAIGLFIYCRQKVPTDSPY